MIFAMVWTIMDVLDGMKTFVAAVETGSFTAAADRLGISRKLVSKYVAQLEDRLGTRLLHRTTRTLSLTDAGRQYYARCAGLLEAFEELESSVQSLGESLKGTLRLAVPSTFGELYLLPLLPAFRRDHPELTIDLYLGDRFVDLASEGIDLALRVGNLQDSGLIARKLAKTELWAVASPGYLAANPAPKEPADLRAHQCIRDTNLRTGHAWPFTRAGQTRKVAVGGKYLVNSARSVRDLALADEGVGLCPDYVVAPDVAAGRLQRLLADHASLSLDIHAVFLDARHMPPKVRLFLDFLVAQFGRLERWEDWWERQGNTADIRAIRAGREA